MVEGQHNKSWIPMCIAQENHMKMKVVIEWEPKQPNARENGHNILGKLWSGLLQPNIIIEAWNGCYRRTLSTIANAGLPKTKKLIDGNSRQDILLNQW